jgi:hypothetical protein
MTSTLTATALAICFAGSPASGQEPVTKTKSISATATIQAIDTTKRTITLRDESGTEDTYAVSPEVKRFNELKVGDQVKMTYYESIVLQVRKPGDTSGTVGTATDAAISRSKGALPGATISVQDKITVTVKAIDAAVPSVTVTTSDGRTVTRKIEDKKYLENLKPGDVVDITYTRALLTHVEPAK